jgi:hypothetical protein
MSCQVLIAAVATVAAMLPGPAGAGPASAQSGHAAPVHRPAHRLSVSFIPRPALRGVLAGVAAGGRGCDREQSPGDDTATPGPGAG